MLFSAVFGCKLYKDMIEYEYNFLRKRGNLCERKLDSDFAVIDQHGYRRFLLFETEKTNRAIR